MFVVVCVDAKLGFDDNALYRQEQVLQAIASLAVELMLLSGRIIPRPYRGGSSRGGG